MVKISGKSAHVLQDSGSLGTLVHIWLVDHEHLTQSQVVVLCVHSDCMIYLTAMVIFKPVSELSSMK